MAPAGDPASTQPLEFRGVAGPGLVSFQSFGLRLLTTGRQFTVKRGELHKLWLFQMRILHDLDKGDAVESA